MIGILAIKTSTTWCILSWLTKVPSGAWVWILLVGSGLLWLHQHDTLVKAETLAEVEGAKSDSLKSLLTTRNLIMAKQDSLIATQTEAIKNQQIKLAQVAIDAQNQTNTAVATLRSQLSDAMKPLLDSITRGYERQLEIKNQQLESERRISALLRIQVAQRDSTIDAIKQLNASISAQLTLANKRTNKGLLAQAQSALPWIAAGYLVGSRAD